MSADSSPPSDGEHATVKGELPPDSMAVATRDSSVVVDPREVTVSIAEESSLEAKSVAMEIDEAFQADPSGFAMSFEELSAENQSQQLYDDLTHSPESSDVTDNQQEQEHDRQASGSGELSAVEAAVPTMTTQPSHAAASSQEAASRKQGKATQVVITEAKQPAKEQPVASTRKSPRRTTEPKAVGNKKAATGAKRGSAAASASHAFSWNDILRVQNLIERCLQQYLSKNEIVMTLKAQADVEPAFTAVVWQKLEEQNPTFFKAYSLQLKLKDQITAYNYLVSQQKEMMAKASGNAAFMSFLSSTESRNAHRQGLAANNARVSRLAATAQARARSSAMQTSSSATSSTSGFTATGPQGFPPPSPLPMPSPIKTDLDTHAFFS